MLSFQIQPPSFVASRFFQSVLRPCLTCGACLLAICRAGAQYPDISLSVSTDQSSYVLGEPIEITVTAHNSSDTPVTIEFGSTLQAQYRLDDVFTAPFAGLTIPTTRTVPAGDRYDWRFNHSLNDFDLGVGTHSVIGFLRQLMPGNPYSLPQTFQITTPVPVVDDVLIDFETYPNGDPATKGVWPTAYAEWGVGFRSEGGRIGIGDYAWGRGLGTNSGSHPFNVVADFSMPVYAVSADVVTAVGLTVRMIAFDSEENVLGMVESAPITSLSQLVGPLGFSSSTPIASVKWLSSQANATVRIDNLRLEVDGIVPEPSSLALMMLLGPAVLWQHRDGHRRGR